MSIVNQSDDLLLRDERLYEEVKALIERSKAAVVTQVNQALVLTYWNIGRMIETLAIQLLQTQGYTYLQDPDRPLHYSQFPIISSITRKFPRAPLVLGWSFPRTFSRIRMTRDIRAAASGRRSVW